MKTLIAAAALLILPATADAQVTSPPGPPTINGVIARVEWPSGKHLRLLDGRYVDLHDYTVIEPEGAALHAGQRIVIRGFFAPGTREGHVTIDARAISLVNGDGQDH